MAASDEAARKLFEEWMEKRNKVYKSEEEKEIRFETFKINLQEGRFGPMAASAKSDEERFEDYIKQYKKEYKTEDEKKKRFKSFQTNLRVIDAYEAFVADQHPVFHAKGLTQYSDLTLVEYLREVLGRDAIPPDVSWSDSDSDGEMVWYRHGYVRDAKGEDEEEDGEVEEDEEEDEDEDEEEDGEKEEDGDEEEDEGVDFRAEGKGKGKDKGELEVEVDVSVRRQRRDCTQ
ncbi:putative cathepsin propeptide inhibitor domain (I29), papain-like cysteine peptidase superfamily [Helianthus annuus]|nr:putative cathepsin propeptide inhibitor domain (I29), papain-like cysteine peptidase superfamily [Helianthus annuus]